MNKKNPENIELLRKHEENEELEFHRLMRHKRMWNPETGLYDLTLTQAEQKRVEVEKDERIHQDGNFTEWWEEMKHKLAGIERRSTKNDPAS
jgi:hypothetical protein